MSLRISDVSRAITVVHFKSVKSGLMYHCLTNVLLMYLIRGHSKDLIYVKFKEYIVFVQYYPSKLWVLKLAKQTLNHFEIQIRFYETTGFNAFLFFVSDKLIKW